MMSKFLRHSIAIHFPCKCCTTKYWYVSITSVTNCSSSINLHGVETLLRRLCRTTIGLVWNLQIIFHPFIIHIIRNESLSFIKSDVKILKTFCSNSFSLLMLHNKILVCFHNLRNKLFLLNKVCSYPF
jgi:hypothetical protein